MDNLENNAPQVELEDTLQIRDLLFLCLRKWYWFVLSVALMCGLAYLHILRTPPVYTRSASVMIKSDSRSRSLSSQFDVPDMNLLRTSSNVDNEIIAIQSPAIMEEVVKRLSLNFNFVEAGMFHGTALYGKTQPVTVEFIDVPENGSASMRMLVHADSLVTLSAFTQKGQLVGEKEESVDGALRDTLTTPLGRVVVLPNVYYDNTQERDITVSRSSVRATTERYAAKLNAAMDSKMADIFTLTIRDVNYLRAEDVLNEVIAVYNEKWVQDRNQIAKSTSAFINERLGIIEQELGNVDTDISKYKSENLLPDVNVATNLYMSQNSEVNRQLVDIENQIHITQYIREYILNDANQMQMLPAAAGVSNAAIEGQIKEYNAQLTKRNNLVEKSSASNPLVVTYDKNLAAVRNAIIRSIDNELVNLNNQRSALNTAARKTTSRIASNPTQARYLLSVERKQKVMESLYLYLLQQREQNELSQAFTAYNTRVITAPRGSLSPTAPSRNKIMLIAFLIGLLIPLAIIYLKETMNTKVRGKKDVEKLTMPFLGEIPMVQKLDKKSGKVQAVVKSGNRDMSNEAFRVLRTNLDFMMRQDDGTSIVMVTSFNPGSGKSFVTMNLAISEAVKNKKVLVIDGDLRHGTASTYMPSHRLGSSAFLSGQDVSISDIIYYDENNPTLAVMPVGVFPPNPTELLEDKRFGELIDIVRGMFDIIFIDCPPMNVVADAQIIENYCTRTIFVVRAGLFEKSMLTELENIYRQKKLKNMALVLNGTEVVKGGNKGYRYGYRYGYHYGYGSSYHYESAQQPKEGKSRKK